MRCGMGKKAWSERGWRQAIEFSLFFGGTVALTLFAFHRMRSVPSDPPMWFFVFVVSLVLALLELLGSFTIGDNGRRVERRSRDYALAVLEKGTGRPVKAGLVLATLNFWPFPTRYEVRQYPIRLRFFTTLLPVTKNPKVVPLSVAASVLLEEHDETAPWLPGYIAYTDIVQNRFKSAMFEVLQHRLPQDLASRLNPYDDNTRVALQRFVVEELGPLHFPYTVDSVAIEMRDR